MTPDHTDESHERFARETADHQMTVVRDCSAPGTWAYGCDIVTWPGYLAVVGDCGDYVFARITDMFEFFEASRGQINPQYWSEKLQAPKPDAAERFSEHAYRARIQEWVDQTIEWSGLDDEDAADLRRAVHEQLIYREVYNEHEAHRLLDEFEHNGRRIEEAWEWRLREYDWQFLWCCHAIVWAIDQYRSKVTPPSEVTA
jgi:hypothetical protein